MDDFENFIKELNNIIQKSESADEILQKTAESQFLDLEKDVGVICCELKLEKEDLFDEFLDELIKQGRIDLIKNNAETIGVKSIFRYTTDSGNEELIEFIEENFKDLINKGFEKGYINLIDIEPFLISREYKEGIVSGISTLIRNLWPADRVRLMTLIDNENKSLGDIENYLADFLYVPIDKKTTIRMDIVLAELQEIESLDKTKLLKEVNENLENLIECFHGTYRYKLKNLFDTIKQIEDDIPKDSEESQNLINEVNSNISNYFEVIVSKYNYNIDIINSLRQFDIDNSKFKAVQDDIIEQLSEENLIKYIQSAKGNEGFDKNWDFDTLTMELFKDNEEIRNDEVAQTTIAKLLEELCKHENVGIPDIEHAGSGFFNFNMKIGDYVLKIGNNVYERGETEIPNDKRILKPIIRQFYNSEYNPGVANIFLEVQNFVDTKWYEGLSEEEMLEQMYVVYKELRDRGKRWTDIKPENLGRLIKPNKENFTIETLNKNGEVEKTEIKSHNHAIGFVGEQPEEILGPGELVIIDIDYIYKVGEGYQLPAMTYYNEFEEKYQKEKREQKLRVADVKEIIKTEGYTVEDLGIVEELLEKETKEEIKGKGE